MAIYSDHISWRQKGMKNKLLVVGGSNQGLSAALLAILAQKNDVILTDKMPGCGGDPFKSQKEIVYEIKSSEMLTGRVKTKPIKQHGQYRQFEKRDKRKNFR